MINSLYSATTALNASFKNQDIVAHNLAHVNVAGFKRRLHMLRSAQDASANQSSTNGFRGVESLASVVDFSPGQIEPTGNPLNVAINGNGFLVVEGDQGPLYTRNGNFHLNENNELTLANGLVVQSEQGPIRLPADWMGRGLQIGRDGSVQVGNQQLGKLQLVDFANPNALTQVGTTLFSAPPGLEPVPFEGQVQQNFLELANTSAVSELIQMVSGMRHLESAQRVLRTISETVAQHSNPRQV